MKQLTRGWSTVTTSIHTEVDDLEFGWLITGSLSKYYHAVTSGPSDRWCPEEGGEMVVESCALYIVYRDGVAQRPLYYYKVHAQRPSKDAVEAALWETAESYIEESSVEEWPDDFYRRPI